MIEGLLYLITVLSFTIWVAAGIHVSLKGCIIFIPVKGKEQHLRVNIHYLSWAAYFVSFVIGIYCLAFYF